MKRPRCKTRSLLFAAATGLLGACMSAEEHRQAADDQVYALIEARKAELFQDQAPFRIDPPEGSLRQRIENGTATDLPPLRLLDCLEIAAENSREYQTRKEQLYLTALDLTLEQWRFQNQYGGTISTTVTGSGEGAEEAAVDGGLSLSRLLGSGAQIVANIGSGLFRILTTGDGWDASSLFNLSITQPLLRGAGAAIVREPLTQAERDLVYEVRAFERFRRAFAVDVADRVYRLLQAQDGVRNEDSNVLRLQEVRRRNEAMAEAGLVSDIEVDQARQDELSSENNLIELRQGYEGQLDDFKIFLGLPMRTELALDQTEIDQLRQELESGDPLLDVLDEERATGVALAQRLDYLTALDGVYDDERRIAVTADALEAGLDFEGALGGATDEGQPARFRSGDLSWSAGLTLDLPLDRLPERNAYRASLIAYQAALRDLEEFSDQIQANLRDLLRRVQTTRQSYELQVNSVRLAERRVESARLNLEAGRAETRDLLDAQRSLLSAQNAATRALIDFALARLDLFLEMEVLGVDQSGIFVDNELLPVETQP